VCVFFDRQYRHRQCHFGKIYNSDRTNRTSTFTVTTLGASWGPEPALFQNGDILILWYTQGAFSGCVYQPDGTKTRDNFVIGSENCTGSYSRLTPSKDNGFVIVCNDNLYLLDSTGTSLQSLVYAGQGASGVYTYLDYQNTVALDSGGFIAFYIAYPTSSLVPIL
jgi:hypothetical protein